MAATALKFWGQEQDVEPVSTPEKGDKRFSAPDWQQNPIFDALKQSYLLAATTMFNTRGRSPVCLQATGGMPQTFTSSSSVDKLVNIC